MLLFVTLLLTDCVKADIALGKVYFADAGAGKILSSGLVPGNGQAEVLVAGLVEPSGVAVHIGMDQIYWTDAGTRKIQRAYLNGSNVQDLVQLADGTPAGITLDTLAGKMYWADAALYNHKIQRANLDGSNVQDFVNDEDLKVLHDVAVHPQGGRLYWTDTYTHKVQSVNLGGTDRYDHVATNLGSPSAIVLDFVTGKIVWTDTFEDEIRRTNFGRQNELQAIVTEGLDSPRGLAIDLQGRKLYWTDSILRKVQRSDLSGGNVETLVSTGLSDPRGIAVVPDETTTTTTTTTTISSSTRSSSTTSTSTTKATSTTTSTLITSFSTTTVVATTLVTSTTSTTPLFYDSRPVREESRANWEDPARVGAPSGVAIENDCHALSGLCSHNFDGTAICANIQGRSNISIAFKGKDESTREGYNFLDKSELAA